METPFKYFVFDSFLNTDDYEQIRALHGKLEYSLKYTDLFKFLQTDEMAQNEDIEFFLKKLENLFKGFFDTTDCYYTIFGSYYRKGDYLLCHDDKVDNRKYAFTYYLDDYESGALVLYNNACDREINRLAVKKNRLVVFEVSDVSWHEVGLCETNGRMAFTGWINHKSIQHTSAYQNSFTYKSNLPSDLEFVNFDLTFEDSPLIQFPGIEYNFDYLKKEDAGPFYMRRVCELTLEYPIALSIVDYTLLYFKAYEFTDHNYILLNDYSNDIKESDLVDIFIFECEDYNDECVKFLGEEGKVQFTLTLMPKVLYAIKRENRKYFIENGVKKNFKLVHMIYNRKEFN